LIEIGAKDGMRTFDESLAELYLTRRISKEQAIVHARDKTRFENMLRMQTERKRGLLW
jgi:Tfp pilus assembly pilus retraction ATPase PilT